MRHTKPIQPTGIAQMIRTDPHEMAAAGAALEQLQKAKPLVPPHVHNFETPNRCCKRCGKAERS